MELLKEDRQRFKVQVPFSHLQDTVLCCLYSSSRACNHKTTLAVVVST